MIEILIPLILLGVFAGLLSGFFGIGSGIILVPAYIFLFNYLNFPPEIIPLLATGSSMGTMAITIPMASYTHYKNKNINLEVIKYMFLAAIIATIFGRYVAANIESSTLQIIIALSLLLAAIQLALDFSPKNINNKKIKHNLQVNDRHKKKDDKKISFSLLLLIDKFWK